VQPEEKSSEIAAAEPYFIGSHSGASGAWVSGPEDCRRRDPRRVLLGLHQHVHGQGAVLRRRRLRRLSHKFSSGSHAEGRIAAKSAIKFIVENNTMPKVDMAKVAAMKAEILRPLETYEKHKHETTDPDINPNYIKPRMFMFRLQKIMDEYAGGISAQFTTNEAMLNRALELLGLPQGGLGETGGRQPARA
jgi:adenylylsulfate reductase subunit A